MRHVPWLTLCATAVFFLLPPGHNLIASSFFSGEQLARSISQFVLLIVLAAIVAIATAEWVVKYLLRRRHARAGTS